MYTDRLKLRLVELMDAEPMATLINDKEIAQMTLGIPHPYPPGSAVAFIQRRQEAAKKGDGFSFAVLDRHSKTFMGIVGLRIDPSHIMPNWLTGWEGLIGTKATARRRRTGYCGSHGKT